MIDLAVFLAGEDAAQALCRQVSRPKRERERERRRERERKRERDRAGLSREIEWA